jgi:hypothetical protein
MKTFRPSGAYVALAALVVVSTATVLALVLFRNVFTNAADVIMLAGSCFVAAGTIVGAYLVIAVNGDPTGRRPGKPRQRLFPLVSSLTGFLRTRTLVVRVALLTGLLYLPDRRRGSSQDQIAGLQEILREGKRNGGQSAAAQLGDPVDLREKVVEPAAEVADSASIAVAPVLGALAGFAGALIPLAYPAGLVALLIQLFVRFEYGFYKALYAASIATRAMVVEKVLWILVFSLFSALIPMWIWYAYARGSRDFGKDKRRNKDYDPNETRRRFRLIVVGAFGLYTSALFVLLQVFALVRGTLPSWLLITIIALAVLVGVIIAFDKMRQSEQWGYYTIMVIVLIVSVACGVVLAWWLTGFSVIEDTFEPGLDSALIRWFFIFTVAEVILGGVILFYRGLQRVKRQDEEKEQDERRDQEKESDKRQGAHVPLYLGLVVVYVGSIAAGVCLAGLQNPSLPTVTLMVKHSEATEVKEIEAGLLSNIGGYWYVVDYCNKEKANRFLAIPNTSVEEADAIVEGPFTLEDGRAGVDCPPETTIELGPPDTVAGTHVRFEFKGRDDITPKDKLRFECRIEGTKYESCPSPKDYARKKAYSEDLNGQHTFWVRAKDEAGNVDDTPAQRTWTVDTIGPDTVIDSGPSGTIALEKASFAFSSPESGATFQCKMDETDYKSCTSRRGYSVLSQGSHTFKVRARDALKNVDTSPAFRKFTVDTVSPQTTITSGPSGTISSEDAQLKFISDEPSTFECKLDGTKYRSCASPRNYYGLVGGEHTFWVRAKDEAGNVDESPAQRAWTICQYIDPPSSL